MTVSVTITDGIITNIGTSFGEDLSEDPEENDYFINYALNGRKKGNTFYTGIPSQIKEKQSTEGVDIVSGATFTSQTLISLCEQALQQSAAQKGA